MMVGIRGWFFLWLGLCFGSLVVGVTRRRLDTRVFCGIWNKVVTSSIFEMLDRGVCPTKVVSRSGMVRGMVDFFEHYLPGIISAVIDLVVACVVLIWVIPQAALVACSIMFFAMLVAWYTACVTQKVEVELQYNYEGMNQAILNKEKQNIEDGQRDRVLKFIKISDWDALGWGIIDIFSIASIVIVLFALINGHHTVGEIMATLGYSNTMFRRTGDIANFFIRWKQMAVCKQFLTEES